MSLSHETSTMGIVPYSVTLVGPTGAAQRGFLKYAPWTTEEWRRVVIQLDVGSPDCPSWDDAAIRLNAIQDLIKLSEGRLSDIVVDALKAHLAVVSCETFRGRPKR